MTAPARLAATLAGLATSLLLAGMTPAAAADADLVPIGSFDRPVQVTAPPGDSHRLFVAQQGGVVRVVRDGRTRSFLDLSGKVSHGSEQGLLGLAFSPRYSQDRTFYVSYTNRAGDTRVVAYRARRGRPDTADPRSAHLILGVDQPFSNHNGGHVAFGPDGWLYLGLGDGGGAGDPQGNAQNLRSPLGKILALSPRGTAAPAGAPPRGRRLPARAVTGDLRERPVVIGYGLRNPWQFSFDRLTGDLVIGDVGQDAWEEIDVVPADHTGSVNFGWRVFEGPDRYRPGSAPGAVPPVLTVGHPDGFCSITGGVVVRDRSLPQLYGRYLYGDFCNPDVRSVNLTPSTATEDRSTGLQVPSVVAFGEDGVGRVYVVSLDGTVSRLA